MRARLINCSSACCSRELALPDAVRIENGEANLVVKIAGQDHVLVDDGYRAVEHDGRCGLRRLCLTRLALQAAHWPA